jgi:acetyl-CoA C-acetyltransferase
MRPEVAVIGCYQTHHDVDKVSQSLTELVFEAARGALDDAGLEIDDIDSVVLAAHDLMDGRSITSMLTAAPAGAFLKDEIRVADDGAFAVALAWLRIKAGDFRRSLVVSWCKLSEVDFDAVTALSFDPVVYRPLGFNYTTAHALQATRYMTEHGVSEQQAARVVVKNRSNGTRNAFAHLRSPVDLEEVMASEPVSWPLKRLDLPTRSDGAAALVLAHRDHIPDPTGRAAWIRGVGWSNDTYHLGEKELGRLASLESAARTAYGMAGITGPIEQLDVAEIHDLTSWHELMAYEALGFCPPGGGGAFLEEGHPQSDGALPVNPSGGVACSHPHTASGLIRVAEAVLQVTGRAGDHQVEDANTALAFGASGQCAQSSCVVIVGS